MFKGRKLVIATKHGKERVIAPLFEKELAVSCFVPEGFDTDVLGTFTGEKERELDPVATARKKCLMAMELAGCDLGIASEGSFGPHPAIFSVPADEEFLIFIDRTNNLEIIAREISTETNFGGREVRNEKELFDFALRAKFPSHGLVLRSEKNGNTGIIKGITTEDQLKNAFTELACMNGSAFAETDMRAMHNPSRMLVIEQAARKLLDRIKSPCPSCNVPGFGVTGVKKGLRCGFCRTPTNSVLSHVYCCSHCGFTKEELHPHGKTIEDPMYCDICNP